MLTVDQDVRGTANELLNSWWITVSSNADADVFIESQFIIPVNGED